MNKFAGSIGLRHRLALALVGLLAVGAITLLLLPSLNDSDEKASVASEEVPHGHDEAAEPVATGQQPPSVGFHAEEMTFESLDEMVASSELVVAGKVMGRLQGEVDAAGTPDAVGHLNAVVSMEEVLKGTAPEGSTIEVKTLEEAYTPPHREWRQSGEQVVLFLSPSTEMPGLYIMTNYSQSAYVRQNGEIAATVDDDPLGQQIATRSMPQLEQDVELAKAKIAKGEVKPKKREL